MAILVVEDDADVSRCVSLVLRDEGFIVDAVGDGVDALDYLRRHSPPSLVILDLGLPRLDGAALRHRMLEDAELAKVPVILLSAERNAASRVAELHACELVRKPFDVEELLHVVQNRAVTVTRIEHFLRGALRKQR